MSDTASAGNASPAMESTLPVVDTGATPSATPADTAPAVAHNPLPPASANNAAAEGNTNSARSRAKIASDAAKRSHGKTTKDAYIPIKYEEDRIRQEAADIANVLELQQHKGQRFGSGTAAAASSGLNQNAANFNGNPAGTMLLVGRRATIGNAIINPVALKTHPRGFKMLSSGSPLERNMKSYFRLPAQPPARVTAEHNKIRSQIQKQIVAAEQKRLKALSAEDAHKSMFGGTSTANNVSTTVTTTISRPGGAVETVTETLFGKQLDGFLLLENSVGLPGVVAYDDVGEPIYSNNTNSSEGGKKQRSGGTYTTVAERYFRSRERQRRREERATAAYERNLRRQERVEARLEKIRRRDEAVRRIREGGGDVPEGEAAATFMTGTRMVNPSQEEADDDLLLFGDDESEESEGGNGDEDVESSSSSDDDELDDIHLAESANAEDKAQAPTDPSLAVEANINDRNLIGVVPEDLSFFTRLVFVDAGENRLLVSDFSNLPSLEELHLHCNMVTQLSDIGDVATAATTAGAAQPASNEVGTDTAGSSSTNGAASNSDAAAEANAPASASPFQLLHSLNLSFNRIPSHELVFLAHLPALTRLDLSNNNIRTLTLDFALSGAPNITHLALEGNKLKNALHIFSCLAVMPSLVEVNLNDNRFEAIPSTTEMLAYLPSGIGGGSNNSNTNSEVEEDSLSIFPSLTALGIADNKLQFVEDVFPVIQFPQLRRIVLWGNPLARQSRDVEILTRELANAGISDIIIESPSLPKRHPQDFYSTRPPLRSDAHQQHGGISRTVGNPKRSHVRAMPAGQHPTASSNAKSGVLGSAYQQSEVAVEIHANVQHIFETTAGGTSTAGGSGGRGAGSSSATACTSNGPGGAFIRLPADVHSDHSRIRGVKGQGLAHHNLPTVLPAQKQQQERMRKRQAEAIGGGDADAAYIPSTTTSRLRSQKNLSTPPHHPDTPSGGAFASIAAPTASATKRKDATLDEQAQMRQRRAEEERWLPAIDPSKFGRSQQRGGWAGFRSTATKDGDVESQAPYYLGGNGGGVTDGSTTQQALSELRRILKH